jgi:hypothetical protein
MPRWSQSITSAESSLRARSGPVQPALFSPLLFVMPLAAMAQGSPFNTGVSAIKALFTRTVAEGCKSGCDRDGRLRLFLPIPVPGRAGKQELFDVQLRWRIAPFLRRAFPVESHCNCGKFCGQCADDNFVLERACRYVSRLLLGHSFGTFPAPDRTTPCKVLSSPSQKADHRHLAAGPLAQLRQVRPELQRGRIQ